MGEGGCYPPGVSLPCRLRLLLAWLDRIRPPRGPCCICGGPDARHRIWDSIDDQSRTSDGIAGTARWLHVTVAEVRLVRAAFGEARRRHAPLPGRYSLAAGVFPHGVPTGGEPGNLPTTRPGSPLLFGGAA